MFQNHNLHVPKSNPTKIRENFNCSMTRFPPEKPPITQSELMKQSNVMNEMEVASILLQLPHLIATSRNRLLPLSWGAKRKRSAEDTPFLHRLRFTSPQSSNQEISAPVVPILEPEPEPEPEPEKQKPAAVSVKVEAVAATTSPATPLSFSPSESDDKHPPKRLKRKSVKKRKEELLQIENELTVTNEQLRKDMEQKRHYLKGLESEKQRLLDRKQELSGGKIKKEREEDGGAKMGDNHKLERMVPDLNVSLPVWMEVYQPLDQQNKSYSKIMAAQARQRRMLICRDKSFGAPITKLRMSRK